MRKMFLLSGVGSQIMSYNGMHRSFMCCIFYFGVALIFISQFHVVYISSPTLKNLQLYHLSSRGFSLYWVCYYKINKHHTKKTCRPLLQKLPFFQISNRQFIASGDNRQLPVFSILCSRTN